MSGITGSLELVPGCTPAPSWDSGSLDPRVVGGLVGASPGLSTGDHPPILPATIDGIIAAAANAELDLDLLRRLLLGDGGAYDPSGASPVGVMGMPDLEPWNMREKSCFIF